jgi:transposase
VIPPGVQVFLALQAVDMRWSFDRLAGIARESLGRDARSGALFVFYGKRRDALKVLFFDGTGMVIFYKRFDRGRIALPRDLPTDCAQIDLDEATFDALLDGVEIQEKTSRGHRFTAS